MSDRQKLFISRSLSPDSPLLKSYPRSDHDWTDFLLLDFEAVDFQPQQADWLFFYSPRSVDFYYKNHKIIHQYKTVCYAEGTARAYRKATGTEPDLITTGESTSTLPILLNAIGDDSICFIRGIRSVKAIQSILPEHIDASESIVYDTILRSDVTLEHYDVALITSPLSYKAFYQNGGTADTIIAIGMTTLNAIKNAHPQQHAVAAQDPSERGMLEILGSL